tara:strand:- start:7643 stop:8926 length:1284 start_codon:yes stop_codon:yes gene_type:complete
MSETVYRLIKERKENLMEASADASTYFEGVIVACTQHAKLPFEKFKVEMQKDDYVQGFLRVAKGNWAVAKTKDKEEKYKILYNFAKVCKRKIPSGKHDAGFGQSKRNMSPIWSELSGKTGKDTSKTDILLAGQKCSVKGPVAQLMSGKKGESKATVLAAVEMAKVSEPLRTDLINAVDSFVDNTRTIGEEVNAGVLKKMTPEEAIKTGNEAAKKIIDEQDKTKDDVNKLFEKAFKDPEVGTAFAYEAMTGFEKFGGKAFNKGKGDPLAEATHMVIWDYKMDRIKMLPIDKNFASKTAAKMGIRADLKSGSYKVSGQKAGYNFYQAVRVSAKVLLDKTGEIETGANEQIELANNMLTEGVIDEGKFLDKIKSIISWIFQKLKAAFNWFKEKIQELVKGVKDLINKGIHESIRVFELDVNVKVNPTVKF